MSNQHRPRSAWHLFAFAVTSLVCCSGLHSASGQIPNLAESAPGGDRPSNPKVYLSHASGRRADNRSKKPSGKLNQPIENADLDAKQEATERAIADGNRARDANDYEQALTGYREAEELNPQEARAYYGLGNVYADLYCTDSAIEAYLKALGLKKDFREALLALGYAYIAKEHYDDAQTQFLAVVPRDAGAKIGLGWVYAKKGKYQEAIEQIDLVINDQSIEAKDRALARIALGDIYQLQKKWQEAIPEYEKAISLNPDPARAYFNIGLAQFMSALSKFSLLSFQELGTQDRERFGAASRQGTDNIQRAILRAKCLR